MNVGSALDAEAMTHRDHQSTSKQHAQRRDVHRRYPLWVYDDDDWRAMRDLPVGDLICPKPGCRAELSPVQLKTGTRFLRNRRGTSDCGHAFAQGQGGGPPSPEHRWLQQRLAMLCDELGYESMQEHAYADVWVNSTPPWAIEVQKWATNFAVRSAARRASGANVLWLLPESASSKKVGRDLFRHPAVRIRVLRRGSRTEEAKPWEPDHSGRVLLWVGATVMRPSRDGLTLVSAGNYDARDFLREVLAGERQWYGPNEPGFKFGAGWAKSADVERMRARRAAHQQSRVVPLPATSVSSTPIAAPLANESELPSPAEVAAVPVVQPMASASAPTVTPSVPAPELDHALREHVTPPPARRPWLHRLRVWLTKGIRQ